VRERLQSFAMIGFCRGQECCFCSGPMHILCHAYQQQSSCFQRHKSILSWWLSPHQCFQSVSVPAYPQPRFHYPHPFLFLQGQADRIHSCPSCRHGHHGPEPVHESVHMLYSPRMRGRSPQPRPTRSDNYRPHCWNLWKVLYLDKRCDLPKRINGHQ